MPGLGMTHPASAGKRQVSRRATVYSSKVDWVWTLCVAV